MPELWLESDMGRTAGVPCRNQGGNAEKNCTIRKGQKMEQTKLRKILDEHKRWIETNQREGSRADLRGAGLQGAGLQGAGLRGADLDYSCWPLWCGSLDVKADKKIAVQLAYHFCRLDCDDPEYIKIRNAVLNFANQFHRVDECGMLQTK